MTGDPIGSPQYYAKYQTDIQTAIDIFRPYGTEVFLIGIPYNASSTQNQNVADLNQLYASVAAANPGVTYVDAGQAVMANGVFTWTLPCLPTEPCTGPSGTNVVRLPQRISHGFESDGAAFFLGSRGPRRFGRALGSGWPCCRKRKAALAVRRLQTGVPRR